MVAIKLHQNPADLDGVVTNNAFVTDVRVVGAEDSKAFYPFEAQPVLRYSFVWFNFIFKLFSFISLFSGIILTIF